MAGLVLACGKRPEPAELATQLESWCSYSQALLPNDSHDVPPAPWPDPQRPDPHADVDFEIVVTPSSVIINGNPTDTWLDFLAVEGKPASTWALVPSAHTSMTEIDHMVTSIAKQLGPKFYLYFSNPTVERPPAPERTAADQETLTATPIDQRAVKLATMLEDYAGGCEPFKDAMNELGKLPPDERCDMVVKLVPEALAGCRRVDHAGTMGLLYLLFVGDQQARVELAVELADAPGDGTLELDYSGGDTWGDFVNSRLRTPPTQPIRFSAPKPPEHD